MALIVEDGTGLENSDSYISVLDADAYLAMYGSPDSWTTASEATKQVALRNATRYLDSAIRWPSKKLSTEQSLQWPREPFYDLNGNYVEDIPKEIPEVTAELAAIHLDDNLYTLNSSFGVRSESWGDSSVEYAGFRVSATNSLVGAILGRLSFLGSRSTAIITTYRA